MDNGAKMLRTNNKNDQYGTNENKCHCDLLANDGCNIK